MWTAPFPDYAPTFLKSESLGYVLSAFMGVGIIILAYLALSALFALLRPRNGHHA